MGSFNLFLEPLCGLSVRSNIIYGGTGTYGLFITVQLKVSVVLDSSPLAPLWPLSLPLLPLEQVNQYEICIRLHTPSARQVTKLHVIILRMANIWLWICPVNLLKNLMRSTLLHKG